MPPDSEIEFLDRKELLSYEEITRTVRILSQLGVRKVRITGGEPLLRNHLENLVSMLSSLEGIEDIALTTNGYNLSKKAKVLKESGLKRITVSLLTLDPNKYRRMVGRSAQLEKVLKGIDIALREGFSPVKVNAVIVKGVNDDEILDLAEFCREKGLILRFIEYMDVGTLNRWSFEKVVTAEEILEKMAEVYRFKPLERKSSETALKFRYEDMDLEFGIVASVTKPFCRGCTRLRLSADGRLFTCLFSDKGYDLKRLLRSGAEDREILSFVRKIWSWREDRYSERRFELIKERKVEMFRVGG